MSGFRLRVDDKDGVEDRLIVRNVSNCNISAQQLLGTDILERSLGVLSTRGCPMQSTMVWLNMRPSTMNPFA
jgi:hypothetical protein